MNANRIIAWSVACAGATWLTWAAYRGPPPRPQPPVPTALTRPATQAEWTEVRALASRLSLQVRAANERAGRALEANELEGHDPHGTPWLPSGLPDNPIVAGVGSLRSDCGQKVIVDADWVYCQSRGELRPGGQPAQTAPL